MMATKKASPPATTGTELQYWAQKPSVTSLPQYQGKPSAGAVAAAASPPATGSATASGAPAVAVTAGASAGGATGSISAATGAPSYDTPKEYIKENFDSIKDAPFGTNGTLKTSHVLSRVDVIRAGMTAGYGNRLHLNGVTATTAAEMRRYLSVRLEMLLTCLDCSGNKVVPKPFYEHVEATEKVGLAFIAGCFGAHLGARSWTAGAGTSLKRFLHAGIYTKATTVSTQALVTLAKSHAKGKTPDFLVQDQNNEWHVFESKGGSVSKRWSQVIDGLDQLLNVLTISAYNQATAAPVTTVCVQTVLEHGKPVSIALVDPPGSSAGDKGGDGGGNGGVQKRSQASDGPRWRLKFVPGVAEMLVAVETLDWFHGLQVDATSEAYSQTPNDLWKFARTTAFGGLVVGVPRELLELEPMLRALVGRYLAVQDAIESMSAPQDESAYPFKAVRLPENSAAFTIALKRAVDGKEFAQPVGNLPAMDATSVYDQISKMVLPPRIRALGAFYAWARHLKLGAWVENLDDINKRARESLEFKDALDLPDTAFQITEGGLYLKLANAIE